MNGAATRGLTAATPSATDRVAGRVGRVRRLAGKRLQLRKSRPIVIAQRGGEGISQLQLSEAAQFVHVAQLDGGQISAAPQLEAAQLNGERRQGKEGERIDVEASQIQLSQSWQSREQVG